MPCTILPISTAMRGLRIRLASTLPSSLTWTFLQKNTACRGGRAGAQNLGIEATQSPSALIVELQSKRRHCAVVADEHGTVVGMVFLEDALEEIVGPIQDEFDEEKPVVTHVSDRRIEVRGELSLPLAREELGEAIEGSTDTLGGYIVAKMGRLPKVGDGVQIGRWTAEVQEVRRKRITRIVLTQPADEAEDARSVH